MATVRRYARALTRDADRADDLVQSVMERALRKRHLFAEGTNLRAWLLSITHNAYVNSVRRAVRENAIDVAEEDLARIPAMERDAIAGIEVKEMEVLLRRLPRQQQRVLVLAALYGENYERMAEYEMVPVGTIRSRLSRGRASLRLLSDGTDLAPEELEKLGAASH